MQGHITKHTPPTGISHCAVQQFFNKVSNTYTFRPSKLITLQRNVYKTTILHRCRHLSSAESMSLKSPTMHRGIFTAATSRSNFQESLLLEVERNCKSSSTYTNSSLMIINRQVDVILGIIYDITS